MTRSPNHEPVLRGWLTLLRAPGVGPAAFRDLLARGVAPEAASGASAATLRRLGFDGAARAWLQAPDTACIDADLDWVARPGNHALILSDPAYPELLRALPDAPPVLFVHGDPGVLALPLLALVGSRNPTPGGRDNAAAFARHLAAGGVGIVSGLALGIDAAAHEGALAAEGLTVAVLGHGLDRVYPAAHRDLAHRIAAGGGALVSEFPPGVPPRAEHFPRRNRIISGLSLGVLVVEAAIRSGSLITARTAAEQGREVFAIPGSIHNPLARGCHRLIRQGAKLVETAADILEELGPLYLAGLEGRCDAETALVPETAGTDPDYRRLLEALGHDPVSVDVVVDRSGLTPEAVSSMLLLLELQGVVESVPGGLFTRATRA